MVCSQKTVVVICVHLRLFLRKLKLRMPSEESPLITLSCAFLGIFKDVRVPAPITCIKLGIPIYFIDHSEFITVQCKKILSRANNEIKCFEFSSIISLENNYSYINFNISICFPLWENMTILSNKLLYLQNTQTVYKICL